MRHIRILFAWMAAFLLGNVAIFAQAPQVPVRWRAEARQVEEGLYEIVFTGNPVNGWHTYGTQCELSATTVTFDTLDGCSPRRS